MQTTIKQQLNGETTETNTHNISTLRGLKRVLSTYQQGCGWGVAVVMPRALADRIGVVDTAGGALCESYYPTMGGGAQLRELCVGRIAE